MQTLAVESERKRRQAASGRVRTHTFTTQLIQSTESERVTESFELDCDTQHKRTYQSFDIGHTHGALRRSGQCATAAAAASTVARMRSRNNGALSHVNAPSPSSTASTCSNTSASCTS